MSEKVKLKTKLITFWDKNGSHIMTGVGVAGVISTAILAAKASPKAADVIAIAKDELDRDDISKEEVKELKKTAVIEVIKIYLPTIVSGALSIGAIVLAHSKAMRKQAAILAAYNLSEIAASEYKDKIKELLGEKKATEVEDSIAKDKINANPQTETNTVIISGSGDYWVFDPTCGRYFKSTIEKVKTAFVDVHEALLSEMYISLNEFYDYLGLPHTTVGDDLGWTVDAPPTLKESYQAMEDGTPCLVMNFLVGPAPMFREF